MSFEDTEVSGLSKIKVGMYYDLHLERIYPGKNMIPNLSIKSEQYGKYKAKIETKYHNSLYRATNLKGIFFQTE